MDDPQSRLGEIHLQITLIPGTPEQQQIMACIAKVKHPNKESAHHADG
jgi:hypothetical protein